MGGIPIKCFFSYNQLIQAIPSPVFLLLQLLLLVIVDTTATLALYIVGQYCRHPKILLPWQREVTISPLYCILGRCVAL